MANKIDWTEPEKKSDGKGVDDGGPVDEDKPGGNPQDEADSFSNGFSTCALKAMEVLTEPHKNLMQK